MDISVYSACVLHTKSLQSCPTLYNSMDCSLPGSSIHRDSLGKNTGVGCHALLQGIFPTQGLSPALADGFFSLAPPIYMCIYVHDSKGSFPLRQKFQSLLLVTILVCLACYNKIPLTEWFKQQKLFSQFWRLEIQNQGSMVWFWWGVSPGLTDSHLLTEFLYGHSPVHWGRELSPSSNEAISPIGLGFHCYDPT